MKSNAIRAHKADWIDAFFDKIFLESSLSARHQKFQRSKEQLCSSGRSQYYEVVGATRWGWWEKPPAPVGLIPRPPDDDGHADDRDDDDDDDLLRLPAQPPAALVGEATRQRNILPARKTVQLCPR